MRQFKRKRVILFIGFVCAAYIAWLFILEFQGEQTPALYFFDVGQGDSALLMLPKRTQILIDGGPDQKVLAGLSRALPFFDRHIELVILTHPQLDHFGGLIEVLERYSVGVVLLNGREGTAAAYQDFLRALRERNVPTRVVREGEEIRLGNALLSILNPDEISLQAEGLNDAGIVVMVSLGGVRALFTGDISAKTEKELAEQYELRADILKVPHHGSKYSSSDIFLDAVGPKIALIGVGKNSYGHPTREALARLASHGSQIFRTDLNGMLKVVFGNGTISVFGEKIPVVQ